MTAKQYSKEFLIQKLVEFSVTILNFLFSATVIFTLRIFALRTFGFTNFLIGIFILYRPWQR